MAARPTQRAQNPAVEEYTLNDSWILSREVLRLLGRTLPKAAVGAGFWHPAVRGPLADLPTQRLICAVPEVVV